MQDVQRVEKEEVQQQQQQEEQLVAAQDGGTMAHNEETEMPLPDSDSHNAAPESEAIENFGDETNSELVDPPQSEFEQMQLHREREELESSDDEEDVAACKSIFMILYIKYFNLTHSQEICKRCAQCYN